MTAFAQPESMRMNSAQGKQVLSVVRGGDFAHPGEVEAIKMVFADLGSNPQRKLLDVGCGLGGTAEEVSKLGFGVVTGLDNDRPTIEYALTTYPRHSFVCGDASDLSTTVPGPFDLVYMFNALYTMPDQRKVLTQCAAVCPAGGELRIFDYFIRSTDDRARIFAETYEGSRWQPLAIDQVQALFAGTGWQIVEMRDISTDYARWYKALVAGIESCKDQILAMAGQQWFEHALTKYRGYAKAAEDGVVGGLVLRATREVP
ncbi:MAG: methyltransferase domain-containing protein [Bdellovibrionota bacterium]|nr:MAG: methyltransferase domain-containing protein [Bdellovibrionota bacterium]